MGTRRVRDFVGNIAGRSRKTVVRGGLDQALAFVVKSVRLPQYVRYVGEILKEESEARIFREDVLYEWALARLHEREHFANARDLFRRKNGLTGLPVVDRQILSPIINW